MHSLMRLEINEPCRPPPLLLSAIHNVVSVINISNLIREFETKLQTSHLLHSPLPTMPLKSPKPATPGEPWNDRPAATKPCGGQALACVALLGAAAVLLTHTSATSGLVWQGSYRRSLETTRQRAAPANPSFARAGLETVLSGSWRAVDLAPLDALSSALTTHLNTGEEILEGHSAQLTIERKVYYALASMPSIRTICEIGFNGGHSAALWLHGELEWSGRWRRWLVL